MRNVWILNHYSQEPGGPGGTRHFSLARHLEEFGWKAWLVAASTEHNTGRQRLPDGTDTRLDTISGVSFLWLRTPDYAGNGLSRVSNMLVYAWKAVNGTLDRLLPRPDVVMGSTVHPLAAVAGLYLSWRYRVPFVFEVRDLWPETLIDMGRLRRNSPVARLMRLLESWLYRRADVIVTLLPRAVDYIATFGVPPEKVVWITNGADLTDFPAQPPSPHAGLTVMYFGSLGQANGMECIIDAMADLKGRGLDTIRLRIIGDGPAKAALTARAARLDVQDRIAFEPPVAKSAIPALAAAADVFVVNLRDLPLYRFGISLNKLFDYMAAARPVVFAGNPVNNPVADAGCGLTVPPDDARAIADALAQLAAMGPEARAAMGMRGRAYVEAHFDYRALSARLAQTLDRLIDDAETPA